MKPARPQKKKTANGTSKKRVASDVSNYVSICTELKWIRALETQVGLRYSTGSHQQKAMLIFNRVLLQRQQRGSRLPR